MKTKPQPTPEHIEAFNRIIGYVLTNLPDSLKDRKAILRAVLVILPTDHPSYIMVDEMLRWLIAHERHQLNLSLDFSKGGAEPKRDHDGDGNGQSKN